MTKAKQATSAKVVDTLDQGSSRPTVKERIERRIDLLESWFRDGVPAGYRQGIPTSLTKLRTWRLEEYGILPIGSPNEFTKTHPHFGGLVGTAEEALNRLLKKYPKAPKAPRRASTVIGPDVERRPDYEKIVGQYHEERHARLAAEKLAATEIQRRAFVEAELASLKRSQAEGAGSANLKAVP